MLFVLDDVSRCWKMLEVVFTCALQDPVALRASLESWMEKKGSKFFMADPGADDQAAAGLPSAAPEELEFEDWGAGEEAEDDICEIDAMVAVDEETAVLDDHEKLQVLEDRSKIQAEMEVLQKEMQKIADGSAPENPAENPGVAETQKNATEEDHCLLTFCDLIDTLKDKPAFKQSEQESLGVLGCLKRMHVMTPYLKIFCSFVCIEDGLLSKSTVKGKCQRENEWNMMMHELHKAKQYARYRAGRSSRMSTWMSVQEELSHAVCPGEDDPEGRPVVPVTACRPISSPEVQAVIFKSNSSLVSYDVGLVLSTYRGSMNRTKGTSRRMCMSKPLATSAPPQVVSKIRLLLLEHLDGSHMVANPLSTVVIADVTDLCGEMKIVEQGEKDSRLYFSFSDAAMKTLQALKAGELMFGKKDDAKMKKLKKIEQADGEEFCGWTPKSFPRGDAGDTSIELLGIFLNFSDLFSTNQHHME